MRVVLWGTCDLSKPRVRILCDGLRANGVELIECHVDLWSGVRDKSQITGARPWLRLLARILFAYPRLLWRYLLLPAHDWVLLGYPAVSDVFAIRMFAWLRGARVAMDWFLSAYDTVVLDRRMVGPGHLLARSLRTIEWLAVRTADRAFMDTRANAARMEQLFSLRPGTCGWVWVGVEDDVFRTDPDLAAAQPAGTAPIVLFYGQFIPLHGIPVIIEAARLLRDEPIDWLLIGTGQEAPRVRALIDREPLPHLRWIEWADYPELLRHIAKADLCLGIFGTSDKAASVIPNKVFQTLAMSKPLVTRDSAAIRELIAAPSDLIQLVPAGDAAALAEAVMHFCRHHRAHPQVRLAKDALPRFDQAAIGRQLLAILYPASVAT
ncbi:glycosyltransferase [Lysobacter sp. M2-1]|uniref:glycosyltransferase n=1 Tax=Lysobacter sp. M2-1 TaxID=2916839 RepID=UPI001F59EE7B|nr:glycosyltransferase [Lysobacter sp. M2-1]